MGRICPEDIAKEGRGEGRFAMGSIVIDVDEVLKGRGEGRVAVGSIVIDVDEVLERRKARMVLEDRVVR